MELLLCLGLTAALARGCLHCHRNFSEKFSFYRHHVNLKSWWVGDIPVSGSLLTDWSQDTMKELHLAIPAEISECGAGGVPPRSAPGPARHWPGSSPASSSRLQPGRSWAKWRTPYTRRWISCTRGRCISRVRGCPPAQDTPLCPSPELDFLPPATSH